MIRINKYGKLWKNASEEEKISYCDSLFDAAKSARRKKDFEWYMNHMFINGHHYVYYNTVTNSIERPPRKRGEVRIAINKIKSAVRAIRNYSTRFDPKWEVVPGDIDPETIDNARRAGKVLDYIYRRLHLESVVGGVVESGLATSVGWVEIDWDDKAENGIGQVRIRLHDPFDIWVDPDAHVYAGKVVGRYICKTTKRSLDAIASDERYDKKARVRVKPDDEAAASPIKARILQKERGSTTNEAIKKATIKEFFVWDDEKNEKGGNITLLTYAGKELLREEPLKEKEFPIYLFQIPQDPLKIYHRSWIADAIPLNKALNRTFSQKVMYVNQALIYRILAEKGHGANVINNEQGIVVEINKNRKFEQMRMLPLPSAIDNLTNEASMYIEDVLSAHEAAIGKLPTGARSGKTLEALQAAESNNLAGIRQSLESFLAIIGKRILEIVSEKYVASRVIKISEPEMDQNGQRVNYLKVIGSKASQKPKGATIVTGEDELIVKIGSWLGYTLEAQRETLLKLGEMGVLPADEILRQFEFPNIDQLSQKAREERLEQHALKAEIAGRTGQGGQPGQETAATGNQSKALADQENTQMMNGEAVPPTEGADIEHTQAHIDFTKSDVFAQAGDDIRRIFAQHIQGELQAQGIGG